MYIHKAVSGIAGIHSYGGWKGVETSGKPDAIAVVNNGYLYLKLEGYWRSDMPIVIYIGTDRTDYKAIADASIGICEWP